MTQAILSTRGISQQFKVGEQTLRAVSDIDLEIFPQETLAIVGESGCGKTTLSRLLLGLNKPSAGQLLFEGRDCAHFGRGEWREFRRAIQPVFQNPYASLNPRMKVGRIIAEPLAVSTALSKQELQQRVGEALEVTGLAAADANKFPHQFSGGQRQRVAIARAIASRPRLIILDEPVSSQDISIQAQILNLLKDLQREFGMSYLFIAHDLATVRFMSDRIAVMYLGKLVESGPCETVFAKPTHPYTRALMQAVLPEHPSQRSRTVPLAGEIPSPLNPPSGCRFHPRCPAAVSECKAREPALLTRDGRSVACLRADVLALES